MGTFWQDIRYGLRMLRRSPGFTAVAVLTLALGIGANTAIFSVVYAVLLRPLPFPQANRLVFLTEWSQQVPNMSFSVADFNDVGDQNTVFSSVTAFRANSYILTGSGEPQRLNGRQVTSGFFPTIGVKSIAGRTFNPSEDKTGAERVVLLSEGFWNRQFGRDPAVVGKVLTLNDEAYTVIGVLPAFPSALWQQVDLWTSMGRLEDQLGGPQRRGNHPGIYVIGRLKPGTTVEQARSQIVSIAHRLAQEYPQSNAPQSMTLEPVQTAIVGPLRQPLLVLLGAVGFVLLIACANVANLLLARASGREREFAIRTALGAGRARQLRQVLTESLLLALVGGAVAIGLAFAGVKGLMAAIPPDSVPRLDEVGLNGTVLAFTAAVSLLTGIIFGLVPAWQASRPDVHDALKEGGRAGAGMGRHRMRSALVVSEVSLALLLLLGAGLMLKSFSRVLDADPGFRASGVLTASISLPRTKYGEPPRIRAFIEQTLEKVRAVPGVEAAGSTLPLLGHWQTGFDVEGRPVLPPGQRASTDITRVSSDYFRAMGVRLLRGRVFTELDSPDSQPVCIVDETFVRAYWPHDDPLGKRVRVGDPDDPWRTVVGVVAHVKNYGVDQPSRVETYLPYEQDPINAFTLVVRTTGDPASLSPRMRDAVLAVDPDVPIFNISTMEDLVAQNVAPRRLAVMLIGVFAGLALLLAGIGLYGVMSFTVSQRTHEIGIRMALGAHENDILRLVVRQGMLLAVTGLGIGMVGAFALPKLIGALLFQTSAADPQILAAVPVLLALVALAACYIPARRAMRVDPMVALRYE
jgi:putative ABC transport system permease protein